MKYKRCIMCEINYVGNDEEICKMCKTGKSVDDGGSLEPDICPFCEKNYLGFNEEKCKKCLNKTNFVAKSNKNI